MNLKQLEAFVKVAETGSFSKAAKILFLTQPTVSAHISTLEKELNTRLFIRNTKEVSLSDDGKLLYQYARQMIDMQQKIEEIFLSNKAEEVSYISIAASTIPAQYLLPVIMGKYCELHPKEQFRIMESDSAGVVEKVIDRAADVGFTGTVLEKKYCKYIPFYTDELVIIAPNQEKYQKLIKEEEGIDWIMKEPFLMREEGSGTRKEAERILKKCGLSFGKLNIVACIENSEAIKRSVKNGMGISIVSALAVKDELEAGTILGKKLCEEGAGRELYLVYNKNVQLAPSVERFVKSVKKMFCITKR